MIELASTDIEVHDLLPIDWVNPFSSRSADQQSPIHKKSIIKLSASIYRFLSHFSSYKKSLKCIDAR